MGNQHGNDCVSQSQSCSYYNAFSFKYGRLDDGTFWVRPPSGTMFQINDLTLRIILELHTGSPPKTVQKKYQLSEEEFGQVIDKFSKEKAIVCCRQGTIARERKQKEIDIAPFVLLTLILGIMQLHYLQTTARTLVLRTFNDALFVCAIAVGAVFFHELGHYAAARGYFKPRFGFTMLSIFPAVYVDTHQAWCLPRTTRILINGSGFIADLLVNTAAIALAVLHPPFEYFVTPFLMLQYARMMITLNPLFSGDGYWMLSDMTNTVNLTQESYDNLRRLKPNLLSIFGLLSVFMALFSFSAFGWYLFTLGRKILLWIGRHIVFVP